MSLYSIALLASRHYLLQVLLKKRYKSETNLMMSGGLLLELFLPMFSLSTTSSAHFTACMQEFLFYLEKRKRNFGDTSFVFVFQINHRLVMMDLKTTYVIDRKT